MNPISGFKCQSCTRFVTGVIAPADFREFLGDVIGPDDSILLEAGTHCSSCIVSRLVLPKAALGPRHGRIPYREDQFLVDGEWVTHVERTC